MNHFQVLQRINQIGNAASNIDELLASVLDEILIIFNCERAWLLYPCDPLTPTWRVPMERTRQEWPGVHAEGRAVATNSEVAEVFRLAIESKKAITYDAASDQAVPKSVAEHFSVKAQMVLAIYPKSSEPWLLGIHHCAKTHVFSEEEQQLFGEISQSITTSLSNLIAMQALRDSERYNRMLFEQSPMGLALCRMNGELVDINPAYAAILGRGIEETLSLTYWEITPKKFADSEAHQLESLEKHGRYGPYEKEYIHKNGHLVPVRLSGMIFEKEGEKFIWSSVEDITERKQAELALLESQKMLQLVLDSIPARVFWKDTESRYLGCNKLFAKDAGLESPEQIIGKSDFDLAWKEQAEIYRDDDREVIHSGQVKLNYEEPQTSPDGESLWLKTSKIPLTDLSQTVIGVLGTYEDITERKRAEEALRKAHDELEVRVQERTGELAAANESLKKEIVEHEATARELIESEQKFHTIFESSNDAIMLLDENGFLDCNAATLRVFACTNRGELLGKHPAELSPPRQPDGTDSRQLADEKIATALRTGRNYFEWMHRRVDGEDFPTEVLLTPMTLEGRRVLQATVRDITERKKAENALRNIGEGTAPVVGQDFFRILVKHLANALEVRYAFVGELTGNKSDHIHTLAVWSDPDYADNFEYSLVGTPCESAVDQELCCFPENIQQLFPEDKLLVDMGADSYIGTPLFDSKGQSLGILAILHDAAMEDASLSKSIVSSFAGRAAAELERKQAEEKTLEVLKQNRDLTQRLFQTQEQERRHLARELHDEFGQWLTVIRLNAHLLDKRCSDTELGMRDAINTIDDVSSQMHLGIRRMIHQLRPAVLDELGLKDSLKELVDQWQVHYPQTHCVLNMEGRLDDINDTLTVTIYRIVQESLTNVAKYAKADNVSILLRRNAAQKGGADYLLLNIEDDGKGIDLDKLTYGFGLAGMRERVLAVGGEFVLKSSLGDGVHIEAQLPATA